MSALPLLLPPLFLTTFNFVIDLVNFKQGNLFILLQMGCKKVVERMYQVTKSWRMNIGGIKGVQINTAICQDILLARSAPTILSKLLSHKPATLKLKAPIKASCRKLSIFLTPLKVWHKIALFLLCDRNKNHTKVQNNKKYLFYFVTKLWKTYNTNAKNFIKWLKLTTMFLTGNSN